MTGILKWRQLLLVKCLRTVLAQYNIKVVCAKNPCLATANNFASGEDEICDMIGCSVSLAEKSSRFFLVSCKDFPMQVENK